MQLDPTRWLVSLAGFTYDWIITREWMRIMLCMFPAALMISGIAFAWWGRSQDSRALASWYMQLGEEEIEGWEDAWAGGTSEKVVSDDGEADEPAFSLAAPESDAESETNAEPGESASEDDNKISPYADMLFRRVQELSPSDRSQFFIAVSLAQKGAVKEGRAMLEEIAPHDGSGYKPAHAFLFWILVGDYARTKDMQMFPLLLHHIEQAQGATRLPVQILQLGSELFWELARSRDLDNFRAGELSPRQLNDAQKSLNLLRRAAEVEPKLNLEVSKRARFIGNQIALDEANEKAVKVFQERLQEDPSDDVSRLGLAELMLGNGDVQGAEALLQKQYEKDPNDKLARGLSEIYRFRFHQSIQTDNGVYARNAQLLDIALRYDPSNPMVVQDIAKLARMKGPASKEMIDKLNLFLAEGQATTLTHAWLAEAYLLREDFKKALPHLEQVVTREPNGAKYLNNLAYVLMELHPERIEEALAYSQRAVLISKTSQPNADYYDTLGSIYSKLERSTEAIAAFENAVELDKTRIDFRERLAAEYRRQGNEDTAAKIDQVIESLRERAAEKPDDSNSLESTATSTLDSPSYPEFNSGQAETASPNVSEPANSDDPKSKNTTSSPNEAIPPEPASNQDPNQAGDQGVAA